MAGTTISIGSFTTDPGISWFTIRRYGILGGTNRINYVRNEWDINARVQSDPGLSGAAAAANLDPKVVALESAVKDGIDIVFSLGSTASLRTADCASGTHIRRFSELPGYDGVRGSGAEGILRRTFNLVVYGDIPVTSADTLITQYRDSLTAKGSGLGKIVPVVSLAGTVQAQQLSNFTPFFATQSGFATGLLDYPTPPLPVYEFVSGVFYPPEQQVIERITPSNWGVNQNTQFTIRWTYNCWSAFALLGNPGLF